MSILTAEAGMFTVLFAGSSSMRSLSGSAFCARKARTRLVSFASIASASEGSVGANLPFAISFRVLNQFYHSNEAIVNKRSNRNQAKAKIGRTTTAPASLPGHHDPRCLALLAVRVELFE